ncbi:putative NBD/HSP70 family sugar kinase [Hungatella effluvii]|uniref:Putative NBD/HSP70 family sugar kinase n=1 Tax=Hungatella effluvii TaxID=1096246 RepID=A0A2V3Y7S4_9FIRM|nr:ROK family protein [Hungatella effluvii]PXX55017.1 putative NBD/HSP70 family sugar kinase [Hungatella effluvii]
MTELSAKEEKILWYIYAMKHVSRKSLLELSHYKAPTLYRVIEALVQNGYAEVSGSEEYGSKGRPGELLSMNSRHAYVFSICILRETFYCAVVDFSNDILTMEEHRLIPGMTPEQLADIARQDFSEACERLGLAEDLFLEIGLSAVGPLDYANGQMLRPLYFLAGEWKNIPIVKVLQTRFNRKVYLDCNARAALMGNYLPNYFERHQNVVYVTVGNGIGSGLVINRKLMLNHNIILDGFAHMTIDMDGRKCTCGEYGCVEAYVSVPAILAQCVEEMRLGIDSSMKNHMDHLTLQDLQRAVRTKDALAVIQINKAANIFAKCILNYLRMVELEAVVLGGSLIEAVPEFYDRVEQYARERNSSVMFYRSTEKEKNILRGIASEIVMRYIFGE